MGYSLAIASLKVKVSPVMSCLTLCDPMDYTVYGILQATVQEWVASSLLQWIFPTQGLNPGLPHCRRILPREAPKVLKATFKSIVSSGSTEKSTKKLSL